MHIKHFLKLKKENNQENWILLTRYNLASILFNIHNNFQYMISNKTMKTDCPKLQFYYEDILTYIKQQPYIPNTEKNSKNIYNEILQNEYKKYIIIAQSI